MLSAISIGTGVFGIEKLGDMFGVPGVNDRNINIIAIALE